MTLGQINKRKILGLYSPSGVFELKKIYAERHEEFDPCCDEKFADVTYDYYLQTYWKHLRNIFVVISGIIS